jgi:hypothetical protein
VIKVTNIAVFAPIWSTSVAANAQVEKKNPTCRMYAFSKRILTLRSRAIKSELDVDAFIIYICI